MVKILANDGIHEDGKSLLEEAGYVVDTEKIPQKDLVSKMTDYDVVIVRSATEINKALIDACPQLKIIARAGVWLDNIDVDHAKSKGIEIMNTPTASAQSVAELVFGHMFNLSRSLHHANRAMSKDGNKKFLKYKSQFSNGIQLRGKTLGIIGFGRVGQEVAKIGLALGMNVMPVDLKIDEADIDINIYKSDAVRLSVKVETYEWEEVLEYSDFLTIHVPFTGGKAVVGAEEIQMMKNGSFIINTSFGGAVDEKELLNALNSGKIAGAGIDTFENEPNPSKALIEHPNVSLSPHIGASTFEARANIGLELADRILAFFGDDK